VFTDRTKMLYGSFLIQNSHNIVISNISPHALKSKFYKSSS